MPSETDLPETAGAVKQQVVATQPRPGQIEEKPRMDIYGFAMLDKRANFTHEYTFAWVKGTSAKNPAAPCLHQSYSSSPQFGGTIAREREPARYSSGK